MKISRFPNPLQLWLHAPKLKAQHTQIETDLDESDSKKQAGQIRKRLSSVYLQFNVPWCTVWRSITVDMPTFNWAFSNPQHIWDYFINLQVHVSTSMLWSIISGSYDTYLMDNLHEASMLQIDIDVLNLFDQVVIIFLLIQIRSQLPISWILSYIMWFCILWYAAWCGGMIRHYWLGRTSTWQTYAAVLLNTEYIWSRCQFFWNN